MKNTTTASPSSWREFLGIEVSSAQKSQKKAPFRGLKIPPLQVKTLKAHPTQRLETQGIKSRLVTAARSAIARRDGESARCFLREHPAPTSFTS